MSISLVSVYIYPRRSELFSRAGAAGVYLQEIAVDIYLRDQGFMVPGERDRETPAYRRVFPLLCA